MKEMVSIVVPCYNEEDSLPLFFEEVEKYREGLPQAELEYIFVNDGSTDQTLAVMRALREKSESVRYVSFSRNFGKESALYAGLEAATGDYVVVMDADLQDPPSMLPLMLKTVRETDFDCVGTRRTTRVGEPPIRSFFAKNFYKLINRISNVEIVDGARDYRMMSRQMVDAILSVTEYNRFSKGIFSWVGFDTYYLEYQNNERVAGETSWSFWSLLKYSIDGIIAFSETPLSLAVYVGLLSFVASVIGLIFIIVRTMVFGDPTSGWPSLVCLILLVGGLQLLCMGILGKYVGKMFLETKKRPIYVVKETEEIKPKNRKIIK